MKPEEMIQRTVSKCQTLEELEQLLARMFDDIQAVHSDGSIRLGRKLVDRIGPLKIEIRPKEHAPPHFHVVGPDCDASFRIDDGSFLAGTVGARERKIIKVWFRAAKEKLISDWDETRPEGCPVGPVHK